MAELPYKKGTLLLPSGPGMHLYVVLTDTCLQNQNLLVSVTSIRTGKKHDNTTELQVGDHPFIKHPSFVYYREPLLRNSNSIVNCIESSFFIPKEDVEDKVFERICEGIQQSILTPQWAIEYFEENK